MAMKAECSHRLEQLIASWKGAEQAHAEQILGAISAVQQNINALRTSVTADMKNLRDRMYKLEKRVVTLERLNGVRHRK